MGCRIRRLFPFLVTIAAVALVTAIKFAIRDETHLDSPVLLYYSAVVVCAWYGGMRQGILAILLSLAAADFFFVSPFYSFVSFDSATWGRFLIFLIDSLVVVYLAATLQKLRQKSQDALAKELAAKKEISESEKRSRSLFEANMIGLFFAQPDGKIIDANDYVLNLLGYERADFEKQELNWRDLTPMRHIEGQTSLKPYEEMYRHKDGSLVPVLVGVANLPRETSAVFLLDIRERKQFELELESRVDQRTQELRKTALHLQQSEHFLESVIENLPAMLFVKDAKDLRYLRFNRAGEELLGYSREELIGRNDYDFFPKNQADFFTSFDRQVLDERKVIDIPEEPLYAKHGLRYLHTKKIPILDNEGTPLYLLGISEDITEKKVAEQQRLARAEAENTANQLRFLSEASRALSESLDLRRTLNAFAQILVVEFADWCELVLIHEEDRNSSEQVIITYRDSANVTLAEQLRKTRQIDWKQKGGSGHVLRTGEPVLYQNMTEEVIEGITDNRARQDAIRNLNAHSIIVAPIQAYGQVLGLLSLAITSSNRNFSDLELSLTQELGKRVAFAVENSRLFSKAQEANRAKSAFLANMSHEVRTPLSAMLGFAELLGGEELNPVQMNYVNTVLKNGHQLLRIVDEILDLSKVESDRVSIEKIEFSLKTMIMEIVNLLEASAKDKSLDFRVLIPGHLPDSIISDPTRLRQILTNVIGNAIKFTPHGFVEVRVECRERPEHPRSPILEFHVTDSGIGIGPEQAMNLFQPFVQADNSMTRRFGGTGLGLFVSRRLARLLGGDVILSESGLNKGTHFVVTVTVDLPLTPTKTPNHKVPAPARPKNSHGRALVVDDAPDNRTLIYHYLSRLGMDADLASTGIEAIERAMQSDYDLILMDIQMPEMDGLEAVRILRAKNYRKPIVALTAHAMKGDREQCLRAGFDDYLGKPIDRERLRQTIDRFTESSLQQ